PIQHRLMQAVTIDRAGGPEVLNLQEIERPAITRPNQLLVRLKAAGINPIDTKIRCAVDKFPVYLPAILGCDGAGVVEAVGDDVSDFKPGDPVYYCQCGFGGRQGNYAEYAVVDGNFVAHKPNSLSFAEAAAAPLVLITAWESLFDRVAVKQDQTVLIHAGAGGVGHVAIPLAKHAGAKVCTTVSTPEKADFVRKLGADKVIFYQQEDVIQAVSEWTDGGGVDIAFDTVGGAVFEQCCACIRCYGDLVTILQPPADVDWSEARTRNLRISLEMMLAPTILELSDAQRHQGNILTRCAGLFDDGKLSITVSRTFPLSQAAQAHRHLEQDKPIGKVVLAIE
ncbi:MAG: zinc-dependent alcohol dehydrogenase family protein, partial [Pseudomonadota bacterium]